MGYNKIYGVLKPYFGKANPSGSAKETPMWWAAGPLCLAGGNLIGIPFETYNLIINPKPKHKYVWKIYGDFQSDCRATCRETWYCHQSPLLSPSARGSIFLCFVDFPTTKFIQIWVRLSTYHCFTTRGCHYYNWTEAKYNTDANISNIILLLPAPFPIANPDPCHFWWNFKKIQRIVCQPPSIHHERFQVLVLPLAAARSDRFPWQAILFQNTMV